MATEDAEKRSELDILFPLKTVKIGPEGHQVSIAVKPLPLTKLSTVTRAFVKVIKLRADLLSKIPASLDVGGKKVAEEQANVEMVVVALDELVELLQYCIDRPLEEIPQTAFPDLIDAFFELNVTDDLVKKWTALADSAMAAAGKSQSFLKL